MTTPVEMIDLTDDDEKRLDQIWERIATEEGWDRLVLQFNPTHDAKTGKFAPKTGGGVLNDVIVRGLNVKDFKDHPAAAAIRNAGMSDVERNQDVWLKEILRTQGFDGKPTVVDAAQMDKIVAGGATELYRGIASQGAGYPPASEHAEAFRSGDMFVGVGLFGSGVYAFHGPEAKLNAVGYSGEPREGAVLRMALKPGAKVITYDEALKLQSEYVSTYGFLGAANRVVRNDVGRFAAFRDYDAIAIEGEGVTILLNRTAVYVESAR